MSAAEEIAREFHEAYEGLAFVHNYETREASRVPWPDVPKRNRRLMIATVDRLLTLEVIQPGRELAQQLAKVPDLP